MSVKNLYLDMYRKMVYIRRFEEAVQKLFFRGHVYGSVHLCIGQEAVSVGVASVLRDEDWIAATYRGHGHALALGTDPERLMAEFLGREDGVCGARAGSMNIVDLEHRLLGCFAIVGGSIAAATGAALTLRNQGGEGVAVAFFGDGAVNQAYFYECLNLAQVLALPIVFVCENNQYGEFTATGDVTPGGITARPAAMGIPANRIDGMDVWSVREAAREAVGRARSRQGPAFIEASTYRFCDHARGDPVDYRPDGEMDRWKARDPLLVARTRLISEFAMPIEELDDLDRTVQHQVEEVREAALALPFPEAAVIGSEFKTPRGADAGD